VRVAMFIVWWGEETDILSGLKFYTAIRSL
jgi:hypothetical protein